MAAELFSLGALFITPGALAACASLRVPPSSLVVRHVTGDWAEMSADDRRSNTKAVQEDSRVFSAYQVGTDRIFVITEADRSATTILLAEEY